MDSGQSADSVEEFRKMMNDLGVMCNDLEGTLQRHKKGKVNVAYNGADDGDYDVPRPASGFFNEALPPSSSPPSQPIPILDVNSESVLIERSNHSTQFSTAKSPTVSAYSSGFGTLPGNKTPQFSFPGPPDFEPPDPPFPVTHSDSDYDEVVSVASDEHLYSKPNKTNKRKASNKSHGSSDYAEVDDNGIVGGKNINDLDDGIPDYDDVPSIESEDLYSKPNKTDKRKLSKASRASSDYAEVDDKLSEATGPADDEFDDGNSDYDDVYSVPSSRPVSLVSSGDRNVATITPSVVEMKQISHKVNQKSGGKHTTIAQTSFMNSQLTDDVEITSDSSGEGSATVPDTSPDKITVSTRSSTHRQQSSRRSNSKYSNIRRNMDLESQKKDRKDCPCECGAAVPLMTFAVIICIIALMMIIIAFVYLGIKNDAYLESLKQAENNVTPGPTVGSGDGS